MCNRLANSLHIGEGLGGAYIKNYYEQIRKTRGCLLHPEY